MMTKRNLSHIFFDVGGVIISDFSGTNRWNELLRDMGVTDANRLQFMNVWGAHKNHRVLTR